MVEMKPRVVKLKLHLAPVTTDLGGTHTKSWRTQRPSINQKDCNHCLKCISFCPEGVIEHDKESKEILIDFEFCKGCGICAYECKNKCIDLVWEE